MYSTALLELSYL